MASSFLTMASRFALPFFLVFLTGILLLLQPACERMHPPTEEERDKLQLIEDRYRQEFEMTRDPDLDAIPAQRLFRAKAIRDAKLRLRTRIEGIEWEEIGPNNVGGRTRAILIDQNDPTNNTVLAAGVAGGIWRTTNFLDPAPSWIPINDFFQNIAVSCIAQDPTNPAIMYFGTGEGWFNADAVRGLGIWKSTDGGNTWNYLASTATSNFYYVQDILVDLAGNLYAATRDGRGIQRSADGGATWTQVLGSRVNQGATNRGADLELASDGSVLATLGVFDRGSIFRSDFSVHGPNVGAAGNWTDITPAGEGTWRRTEIAAAPSNPDRIYALCHSNSNYDVDKIFRTDNGGISWTTLPVPTIIDQGANSVFTRGQAWYDLIAAVDPNDPDVVYIGGVDALRSTDAGQTWEQITTWSLFAATGFGNAQNVHADHHQIVFFPGSSASAVWGTDGGLYFSSNLDQFAVKPSFTSKNLGYNVTQFYSGAIHPEPGTAYYLGGTQDNGSQQFDGPGLVATRRVTGGDGGFCHIDADQPNIQLTSYVRNNVYLSTNGFNSYTTLVDLGSGRFINPSDYDSELNAFYAAGNDGELVRVTNVGGSNTVNVRSLPNWQTIQISALTADPNTTDRLWAGLSGGGEAPRIIRIDGASTFAESFTERSIPNLPNGGYISCIEVQPGNADHLLVALSNYGVNSLWESTDGGQNWTSVEGDLPDMPVRWVVFDPVVATGAVLATELGVWTTDQLNGVNTDWEPTNSGLANVRVDMLQVRAADKTILAATHGRGMFVSQRNCEGADPIPGILAGQQTPCNDSTNTYAQEVIVSFDSAPDSGLLILNGIEFPIGAGPDTVWLTDLPADGQPVDVEAWFSTAPYCRLSVSGLFTAPLPCQNPQDASSCLYAAPLTQNGTYQAPGPAGNNSCHNCSGASHANWYVFQAPANGLVTIGSCNGGADTRLWAYEGACGQLELLTDSDDVCQMGEGEPTYASEIADLIVQAGRTYFFEWDDRWSNAGFEFYFDFAPQISCGPDTLFLADIPLDPGEYRARDTIRATGQVIAPDTVHIRAGSAIRLLPGFRADSGSVFSAMIDSCVQDTPLPPLLTEPVAGGEDLSSSMDWRVFPNPFSEVIRITAPSMREEGATLTLYTPGGSRLITRQLPPSSTGWQLETPNLPAGLYILVIRSGKERQVRKVVKW